MVRVQSLLLLPQCFEGSVTLNTGNREVPHALPLRAEDLRGMPRALPFAATRDPLRDDVVAFARRLDSDMVDVSVAEYPQTVHAILNFPGVSLRRHATVSR